jgi:hypothetical protein
LNLAAGGNGGSGIFIMKYPIENSFSVSAGLSATTYTSGGFKYTKITAGTGNITLG